MPKSRKRKSHGRSRPSRTDDVPVEGAFLVSDDPTEPVRDARSWPVVRAYVPVPEAWAASGYGTAGIVREQPDGMWAHAMFTISLLEGGMEAMIGSEDEEPRKFEEGLAKLRDLVPPFEEGPVELASEFIWGAYAYTLHMGGAWPPGHVDRFLSRVPKPPGNRKQWLERFAGPNGFCPRDLLKLIGRLGDILDEVPEEKEIAIFTTSIFEIEDAEAAVERLRERTPEFAYLGTGDDEEIFDFTREVPKRGWNPFRRPRRQSMGTVAVSPGGVVVETLTLSNSARIIQILKETFGDDLVLEETSWESPSDVE